MIYPTPERYQGGTPQREILALAKKYLCDAFTARCPIAAGTDYDLIFLLRNPPPLNGLQAVTFAINPQVHTTDNASVMETLEAQAHAMQRVRQLAGATPVMVSPITLKPRHNPYASPASSSEPSPRQAPDRLPPQVDARQMSLFAAAWSVGSLRALALGGAHSLTYFETTSWRGVMETANGSPLPELFHSIPGSVFPVYHVFAAMADFYGGEAQAVACNDPQKVQALGLQKNGSLRLLVANLSPARQWVKLQGLATGSLLRLLDEQSAGSPEALAGGSLPAENCPGELHLLPYSLAFIDEVGGINRMEIQLAYGKTGLVLHSDPAWNVQVVEPRFVPAAADPLSELRRALQAPIRAQPLADQVRPGERVAIVVNDITRATPSPLILKAILDELPGVRPQDITIFNALGTHRPNTESELRIMLSEEIVAQHRLVQNNAFDPETQVCVGKTNSGNEIWLNRELVDCDLKSYRLHRAAFFCRVFRRRQSRHAGHGRPGERAGQPLRRQYRRPACRLGRHAGQPDLGRSARSRPPGREDVPGKCDPQPG